MKRKFLSFSTFLFAVITCFVCLVACDKQGETDSTVDPVCITCETVTENETLLDVMAKLKEDGTLTYEVSKGMVTSINGTANGMNSYWMLYTSDAEMSNSEWGTYEYDGKTLGSAVLGADELVAVAGEIYVWVYTIF